MLATRSSMIRVHLLLIVFAFLAFVSGCSSSSNPTSAAAAPAITSVSPTSVTAGAAAFTLTVNGSGFVSGSTVQWNGSNRTTTFGSATQVSASILATDVTTAGPAQVTVLNPDGQKSAAASFTINAPAPVPPTLTSLSPTTAVAGSAAFTLTVNGTGFTSGAAVAWAGAALTTTFVSSTQLTATVPVSDLITAGPFSVDVAQGSLRSTNQLTFTVTPVIPTLTSLSPTTIVAGSAGFTLTVNGTGFTNAASVTFNGSAKATTFVNATQLTAAITTADLVSALNAVVDVVQGGVHAASTLTFAITVAPPAITSLSPTGVLAGSADTTLTVNGTGFFADSVVKSNGTALTTTFKSSTQLQATLPAASLISATTLSITVVNPAGEGGGSTGTSFTITAPVSGKVVQLVSPDYLTGGVSNSNYSNIAPTLSQSGRYVAFASVSSDLVAGDTDTEIDAFLRDTCVGASGCTPATRRMSVDPDSFFLNGSNRMVVLSSDARFAAFDAVDSRRTDFTDNCIGASGCTTSLSHVSILPGGSTPVAPGACCSVLSPDGRYVLFSADDPVTTALPRGIYVRDTCAGVSGCTASTTQVVLGPGSTPPRQPFQEDISSGGRYVLFHTAGNDIIPTYSASTLHLFMEDTCIGAPAGCATSYTPIDVRADGTEGEGNQANDASSDEQPSFSKDGRYVVFSSTDQHLVAGVTTPHVSELFLRDTCNGAAVGCIPATTLVSFDPVTLAKNSRAFIGYRTVSEHGRYVAYTQEGLDSTNQFIDSVRVTDTCIGAPAGCVPSISTASLDPDNIVAQPHTSFFLPSISADGHYVAFVNGTNGQVYLALTGY